MNFICYVPNLLLLLAMGIFLIFLGFFTMLYSGVINRKKTNKDARRFMGYGILTINFGMICLVLSNPLAFKEKIWVYFLYVIILFIISGILIYKNKANITNTTLLISEVNESVTFISLLSLIEETENFEVRIENTYLLDNFRYDMLTKKEHKVNELNEARKKYGEYKVQALESQYDYDIGSYITIHLKK